MRIPNENFQTNKNLFVTIHPKNACKLEFSYHLWLSFLDQPQSYAVVLEIITFHIYHTMVTKWKHILGPNDLITFNKEL